MPRDKLVGDRRQLTLEPANVVKFIPIEIRIKRPSGTWELVRFDGIRAMIDLGTWLVRLGHSDRR